MLIAFSKPVKLTLVLFTFAVILWLGGGAIRAQIGNEFFIPMTLDYRPDITLDEERTLFQLLTFTSTVTLIAYGVVLITAIFLVIKLPLKFREHGWFMAASILFFLFLPVEIFTSWLDLKFIFLWLDVKDVFMHEGLQSYAQYQTVLRETLSHRIGALSGLPVIALLCYYTAVVLVVWQPMKRTNGHEKEPTDS